VTNLTASVSFTSNRWCQLALTYTNGAVALWKWAVGARAQPMAWRVTPKIRATSPAALP
jgi:hypothetical protein